MKKLRTALVLSPLLYMYASLLSASEILSPDNTNGHNNGRGAKITVHPDTTARGKDSPDSVINRKSDGTRPSSANVVTTQQDVGELTKHYQAQGLSFTDAMLRAMREVKESKETPLEKELRALGCVQWGEISKITRDIVDEVKLFRNPDRGSFILKPGLQIMYLNEAS